MHRRLLLRLASVALAVLIPLTLSTLASAHAILVHAVPASHATVTGNAISIKLQFNVRIDIKRSRIALVQPDKSQQLLAVTESTPGLLEAQVSGLKSGDYTIRWQVLASDGHITQGEIPFKVI